MIRCITLLSLILVKDDELVVELLILLMISLITMKITHFHMRII